MAPVAVPSALPVALASAEDIRYVVDKLVSGHEGQPSGRYLTFEYPAEPPIALARMLRSADAARVLREGTVDFENGPRTHNFVAELLVLDPRGPRLGVVKFRVFTSEEGRLATHIHIREASWVDPPSAQ